MTNHDRLAMLHEYFNGCFNPNIEPSSIAYWNGLPVIHDKIAKRYLIIMSEGQFESLTQSTGGEMTREQYDAKMKVVYEQWSRCGVDNENLLILQGWTKDEYIESLEAELESLLKAQEEK